MFWLFWDDGEVFQRLGGTGVFRFIYYYSAVLKASMRQDEAVGVPAGAVVAVAFDQPFLAVVIQAAGLAGGDEDDLAVRLVFVVFHLI